MKSSSIDRSYNRRIGMTGTEKYSSRVDVGRSDFTSSLLRLTLTIVRGVPLSLYTMSSVRFEGEIVVSAIDKREYRHITLPNKLQALLVHDPKTEKSSACCDVLVGSLSDPKEAQGLAHFLEHMLFMGTEKYPVENAYSAYLNSHGGFSNAYTSQENTVYYFDVQNDHIEGALDMFASFFTCPLLSDSSTTREINAVDSENTKNLQSDMWRKFQLFKSLAREDHPLNSFSTGNLETLSKIPTSKGLNTRDMVVEFYHKHYSANNMKVVVYAKESLDTLEQWVVQKFSEVPNKDLPRTVFDSNPFGPAQVQKYLEVVPIRDVKSMTVSFPIPATEHRYLTKPTSYLGHLLGHESGGSILSALKARRWANGLSAGSYLANHDFAAFTLTIELSDEGVNHIDEIAACVFAYIGMLKRVGPQEWVWNELKETGDLNFRFLNQVEPSTYATNLANGMHTYSIPHTVCGSHLQFQCDLPESAEFLSNFRPDNSIITVSHRGFSGKTALKEKYYGTEHNKLDYSPAQVNLWNESLKSGAEWMDSLSLPLPNPFIPTDFELKTAAAESVSVPVIIERQSTSAAEHELLEEVERVPEPVAPAELDAESTEETECAEVTPPVPPTPEEEAVAEGQETSAEGEEEEEGGDDEDEEEEGADNSGAELPVLPGDKLLTWHLQDATWAVPKVNVKVSLESLFSSATAHSVVLTELFAMCLKENLNEYSYYADCAGLCYEVSLAKGGLDLSVQGYGHKLPVLVSKIVEEMQRFGTDPTACSAELFTRMQEKSLRNLKNYLFWQPYYHCLVGSLMCLEDGRFGSGEKYAALEAATLADFTSFVSSLVKVFRAQVLVHGNITASEAQALTALITEKLPFRALPHSQVPARRVASLAPGSSYVYRQHALQTNPQEQNSAVENVYMVGLSDGATGSPPLPTVESVAVVHEATLELLAHMMSEPAFDQLRTKEQLGYIVFTGIKRLSQQYLTLHLIVQSSHRDADYLDGRVESFLVQYREILKNISAEDFQANIAAVIEKLLEKPKNIDQECDHFWAEVTNGMYWFQRRATLAALLRSGSVTVDTLLQFFDTYVSAVSPQRTKFSSQFYGQGKRYIKPANASVQKVSDPNDFKRAHAFRALPKFAPL